MKTLESREPPQLATATAVKVNMGEGGNKNPPCQQEDDFFCYRCGEDGHISTKCTAMTNEKKVIRKLIASLRKSKEKQNTSDAGSDNKTTHCSARTQTVHTPHQVHFQLGWWDQFLL